ncbi:MAG: IS1595 family transposase [Rhizomicrobium sp.]
MKLNDPTFTDEAKARAYFEARRWPNGPFCTHCGETVRVYALNGKATRPGLFHCNSCSGQFTVMTGSVMESSHLPLTKWALGFSLMTASKNGISAHQLHRNLGITYKAAWFMAMRIREAMAPANSSPLGGEGKIVESDETELSPSHKTKRRPGRKNKKFVSLIERGGRVRSQVVTGADKPIGIEIQEALHAHLDLATNLHTDGAGWYKFTGFTHESVDHNKTHVRTTPEGVKVHTNSAEGYFSIFKRGLVGTYQHMSEQHSPRYLNEFDIRMSNRARLGANDEMRASRAIKGAEGIRLTYRQPNRSQGA